MPAPRLSATAIVADDPLLLAEITTLIAKRTAYLPLFAGPRLERPDADNEVARIRNAIARVKPTNLICAGLPEATCAMFDELPWGPVRRVNSADEVVALGLAKRGLKNEPLRWGRSHIGLGVLRALREHRRIVFDDIESPRTGIDIEAAHIVVCEDGDLHSQVLAAAYAMSLDAGLCVFPEFPRDEADAVLEALYVLNDRPAPADRFEDLRAELRAHIGELDVRRKSLTFITEKIPWGLVFQDLATTHLFRYPYLGIGLVNGIAAEHDTAPGVRSAVVIAPHSVESADATTALTRLTRMGVMSKALRGRIATVHQAAKTITLYPYDLLLIAAHCNDAPGYRCTYEFVDTDGRARSLVVDEAAGVEIEQEHPRDDDEVHVTVFERFVSLDGVDWSDRAGKAALPVGAAMTTYVQLRGNHAIEPVRREPVERVRASAALRMADGNYIALPEALASTGSPIVINNACGSWHRLAETFMGSNARCYVGTLFSVLDAEAEEVVRRLFERYLGMELATALLRAQAAVCDAGRRRSYVMVGCHFQRIHKRTADDPLPYVVRDLEASRRHWQDQVEEPSVSEERAKTFRSMVAFLDAELETIDTIRRRGAFRS